MRRWAIINTLLGAVVLLLGLEIVRTWARALPPIEVTPRGPAAATPDQREKGKRGGEKAAARAQQAQQAPAVMVAAIAEKDLFDQSRRAPTDEVRSAETVREIGPPQGVTIVGVRIFGKDREAFVTDAAQGNQQRRLRIGDQVGGYTVKAIEAMAVTLSSPSGDTVGMPLVVEKGKAPAAPGRPATPARVAGQPMPSPAAGVTAAAPGAAPSPAAGVPVPVPASPAVATPGAKPPMPPTPPAGRQKGGANPQVQQLPAEVRQKLEQLKQNDAGSRLGRKR